MLKFSKTSTDSYISTPLPPSSAWWAEAPASTPQTEAVAARASPHKLRARLRTENPARPNSSAGTGPTRDPQTVYRNRPEQGWARGARSRGGYSIPSSGPRQRLSSRKTLCPLPRRNHVIGDAAAGVETEGFKGCVGEATRLLVFFHHASASVQ